MICCALLEHSSAWMFYTLLLNCCFAHGELPFYQIWQVELHAYKSPCSYHTTRNTLCSFLLSITVYKGATPIWKCLHAFTTNKDDFIPRIPDTPSPLPMREE